MGSLIIDNTIMLSVIAFTVACVSSLWIHPKILKVAKVKDITDNPDKRKLQREPIPVLGGSVVFFGIVMGVGLTSPCYDCKDAMFIFAMMVLMLYTGVIDDIYGLTPKMRFVIEILAALAIIFIDDFAINSFHGLWNIYQIPTWIGIPLTVLTVVGIVNSINLIDGVDGLSSGYCILACTIFGVFFALAGDTMMTVLATASIGALLPFFIHNVFGHSSKMFIGDSGTLMLGVILSMFVLKILDADYSYPCLKGNFGLIPFNLSVLVIPVFDTLRVMSVRILHGTSPFNPDKTHLHHALIGLGFTHFVTTLSILGLNLLIVAGWYLLYILGYSASIQMVFVIITALLFTCGVYLAATKITSNRKCSDSL